MIAAILPPVLALATAESAAQPVSIQTALLIILGIGLLWAAQSLAALHRRVDQLSAAQKPRSTPKPAVPSGSISPEVLAVITAAVYESLGSDHRIVSINADGQNPTWSMEGRRQIFSTRKVR